MRKRIYVVVRSVDLILASDLFGFEEGRIANNFWVGQAFS